MYQKGGGRLVELEEGGIGIPKLEKFEKCSPRMVLRHALHARGLKLWDTLSGK